MTVISNKMSVDQRVVMPSEKSTNDLAMPADARTVWLILAVVLLACLSVTPGLLALVEQWSTVVDYDYCFLIVLICVVWLCHGALRVSVSQWHPDRRLLAALMAASAAGYILWQGHSELGAQLLLPPIVWLAIASVTGWAAARPLLAPIAYFYFAIPIWDQLLPMLQQLTLFGAELGMKLAAVPVSVAGNKVSIAAGTFEVIYGCSGLRYLVVALALASLLAMFERMTLRRLVCFLALAAVLAVLANWLRVFIVMYAGHVTGMRHYFVTDNHEGIGHVVFAGLLLLIYWLARLFRGHDAPVASQKTGSSVPAARILRTQLVAVAAILMVFAGLTARASWALPQAIPPQLQPLPVAVGDWQGPLPGKSRWQPVFDGASDTRQASYVSTRGQVHVYMNVYGPQTQGNELIFYRNSVYAPGNWQLVAAALDNALLASIGRSPLITEQLNAENERWLIGRIYVVGGHRTATGLFAQLLYGLSTITRPAPAGAIAFAVQCSADCAAARSLMEEFWLEAGDGLLASIPQTLALSEHSF